MAKASSPEKLVARLRELEAEALRLVDVDLPTAEIRKRQIYKERLDRLEASHSRSWFGDHASTYYGDFQPPPGGRTFDVEWGFIPGFHGSHNPGWRIFSRDDIRGFVFAGISEEIFYQMESLADHVAEQLSNVRDQALDVVEALSSKIQSKALPRYVNALETHLTPYTIVDSINGSAKSTPNITRDSEEIMKGKSVPAHVQYLAPFQSLDVNRKRLRELATTLRKELLRRHR
jgi:hypothetical protein